MRIADLLDAIDKLQPNENDSRLQNLNKWRKRVIAVIGAHLRRNGYNEDIDQIKAVACRAAMAKKFNHINESTLIRVYSEFARKQEVHANSNQVKVELLGPQLLNTWNWN